MRDILDRIRALQAGWREECGSDPDTLYIGRQEFGLLKKQVAIEPQPGTGQLEYDGMRIVRNQRPQHLTVGREQ
jgi:hypothetical protein